MRVEIVFTEDLGYGRSHSVLVRKENDSVHYDEVAVDSTAALRAAVLTLFGYDKADCWDKE